MLKEIYSKWLDVLMLLEAKVANVMTSVVTITNLKKENPSIALNMGVVFQHVTAYIKTKFLLCKMGYL